MGNRENHRHWAESWYDATAAQLLLYGRAMGLSHAEAEDVLHDLFAAVLQLAAAPANPRHYLLRSFRNRALNYRRGWWRRLTRELESRRWFDGTAPADPREQAAMRALADLPREQREVIVLKVWHGLTFREIADLLDVPPNTAAGRYRYGIERLRRVLEVTHDEISELGEDAPESPAWLAASTTVAKA